MLNGIVFGFDGLLNIGVRSNKVELHWQIRPDPAAPTQRVLQIGSARGTSLLSVLIYALGIAYIVFRLLEGLYLVAEVAVVIAVHLVYFEVLKPRALLVTFNPVTDELLWEVTHLTRRVSRRFKISAFHEFQLKYDIDWRGRPASMCQLFIKSPYERLPLVILSFREPDELRSLGRIIKGFIRWKETP